MVSFVYNICGEVYRPEGNFYNTLTMTAQKKLGGQVQKDCLEKKTPLF